MATAATHPRPEPEQADFYADASVYDILHTPGTAWEVSGLERMCERFVSTRSRNPAWLEPACGTGRYLRVAAGRGRRVAGFDLEPGMISYAKQRAAGLGLRARSQLFVGDMTSFAGDLRWPIGFAFNLINTIRHLDSDAAMLQHFTQIAEALSPGGVYAVGLSTVCYEWEQPLEDTWSGTRGRCEVTQTVQYLPPSSGERFENVVSHLTVRTPKAERHIDSGYRLRTYDLDQWMDLIAASSLRLRAIVGETGRDADPPMSGYAIYIFEPG